MCQQHRTKCHRASSNSEAAQPRETNLRRSRLLLHLNFLRILRPEIDRTQPKWFRSNHYKVFRREPKLYNKLCKNSRVLAPQSLKPSNFGTRICSTSLLKLLKEIRLRLKKQSRLHSLCQIRRPADSSHLIH